MIAQIAVAVAVGLACIVYKTIKPPPPKICGKPGNPPVTAPRVRMRDGRYIAYKYRGVPKEKAKHIVVVCHGFHDYREMTLPYPQELLEELGVCFLVYDRPGYGESDPNSGRNPKSDALDIEEIADQLNLGSKFHVLGLSIGCYVAWGCLIYIPHRLSGLTLVAPLTNYYWSGFPSELANKCFYRLPKQDQWSIRIAHHAPWLFYWYMTSKWFASLKTDLNEEMFTKKDVEIFMKWAENPNPATEGKAKQQGEFYCLYTDLLAGYGHWEINPLEIKNPYPNNDVKVHLWQGEQDRIIPLEMIRFITKKHPWIKYHELKDCGHMFFHYSDKCEEFLRVLVS